MQYINSNPIIILSHYYKTHSERYKRGSKEAPVIMELNRVALMCAIICFAHVCAMPTKCVLQKQLMMKSYALLDTMGGLFPERCLDDDVPVPLPLSAFQPNEMHQVGKEKVIYQTLQNIDTLFGNAGIPDSWNEEKLDGFLHIIYRQINDSRCILTKPEAEQNLDGEDALQVYFDTISSNMKEKNFSSCAWEVARKEVLRILDYILRPNTDVKL